MVKEDALRATCMNCSREFKGRRGALTCSPACRVALYRTRQRLQTHRIEALQPKAIQQLTELQEVSGRAYRRIVSLVEREGAQRAEEAIYAAWEAVSDLRLDSQLSRSVS